MKALKHLKVGLVDLGAAEEGSDLNKEEHPPEKKCVNCGCLLSYNSLICWHCGEVFFNVCPKCKSLKVIPENEFGLLKCPTCGIKYYETDLIGDLLMSGVESNQHYNVLKPEDRFYALRWQNVGIRENTIWELCKRCPFEQQCEYYCPAFLALLGLVWRGKVSVGRIWGEYKGGDLLEYKIRWKRQKWRTEE